MLHRFTRLAALLLVGAAASVSVAACGSSKDGGSSTTAGQSGGTATVSGGAASDVSSAKVAPPLPDGAGKGVHVAYLSIGTGNSFTDVDVKAMRDEAKRLGADVTVYNGGFDAPTQLSQCQDAITTGKYQAAIAMPLAGPLFAPCVTQLQGAGIPLVGDNLPFGDNNSTPDPAKGLAAMVTTPVDTLSKGLAEGVTKACAGVNPCNIAVLRTTKSLPQADASVEKALRATVAAGSGMKIVAEADAGVEFGEGQSAMQNILQKSGDLDVVVSNSEQASEAIYPALKNAGKTPGAGKGQVRIVGQGASKFQMDKVASGEMYAVVPTVPQTEAKLAMNLAIRAAKKMPLGKPGVELLAAAGIPLVIYKDTLKSIPDFKAQW